MFHTPRKKQTDMPKTIPKQKCFHCGKSLVTIGRQRKKGKRTHNDWSSRVYHKKCFKELKGNGHLK